MGLRWPYLEAINLSFIFIWGDRETEDRFKVSTSPLFEGSSINNNELWDNSTKTKCMAMRTWLEIKRQDYGLRDMYDTELLANFIPL